MNFIKVGSGLLVEGPIWFFLKVGSAILDISQPISKENRRYISIYCRELRFNQALQYQKREFNFREGQSAYIYTIHLVDTLYLYMYIQGPSIKGIYN